MNDEDPIDAPVIRAVMVAGTQPDTEAAHVLVVWDELDEAADTIRRLLPQLQASLTHEARFGGELVFFLAAEFIEGTKRNRARIAQLETALRVEAADWRTSGGQPWAVSVRLGV